MSLIPSKVPDKNTPRGERYKLSGVIPTGLKNIVEVWAEKAKGVSSEDLKLFWWQSQTVAAISRDPDRFAPNRQTSDGGGMRRNDGVDALLETLGVDSAAKRQYLNVASHITPELYQEILGYNEQAGPMDTVLTKTHLLHLSSISSQKIQRQLVKRVINEGISAALLREEVTKLLKADNTLSTTTVQQLRPTKIADQVSKAATNLLLKTEPLDNPDFLTRLSSVKEADVAKLMTNLDNAMEAVNQVRMTLDRRFELLERAKAQLLQPRKPAAAATELDIPEAVKPEEPQEPVVSAVVRKRIADKNAAATPPAAVKRRVVVKAAEKPAEGQAAVAENQGGFLSTKRVVRRRVVSN